MLLCELWKVGRFARNSHLASHTHTHTCAQVWQQTAPPFFSGPSCLLLCFSNTQWSWPGSLVSSLLSSVLLRSRCASLAYHPFVEHTERTYLSPVMQNTNKPLPSCTQQLFHLFVRGSRHENTSKCLNNTPPEPNWLHWVWWCVNNADVAKHIYVEGKRGPLWVITYHLIRRRA